MLFLSYLSISLIRQTIVHVSSAVTLDFFSSDETKLTHDTLDILVWKQTTILPGLQFHRETQAVPMVSIDIKIHLDTF